MEKLPSIPYQSLAKLSLLSVKPLEVKSIGRRNYSSKSKKVLILKLQVFLNFEPF